MATFFDKELETPDMETLASLAENLVYRLPGCTDVMIRKTIQEVYRDFCRRSCCLRGRRQFDLDVGVSKYAIKPMFGGQIDSIVEVTYRDMRLTQGKDYSVGSSTKPTINFRSVFVPCEDDPIPTVEVVFVEIPLISSETAPSWFIQKYGDYVNSGVLARLYAMSGKSWSDAAQAQIENVRYENGIGEARIGHYSNGVFGDDDCGFFVDTSEMI